MRPSDLPCLPTCRLYGNEIGPEGAKALAPALAASGSLTRLDVSYNYLDRGGQGVKILRDAVSGRKGFVLIDNDND